MQRTFNFTQKCQRTGQSFSVGEQAMLCLNCGRVLRMQSYSSGKSCQCSHPTLVEAVAGVDTETIRIEPNQSSSAAGTSTGSDQLDFRNPTSNLPPRNTQPPIVSQRNQNQGIGISSSGTSSGTPTRNSSTSTLNPRLTNNNNFGWLIGAGAIVLTLSAIALPSFTNQANKAKQSEAKQYVASMNRAQQALFAENTSFASKIPDLGLGIKSETDNYKYQIPQKLNNLVGVAVAQPKKSGLKGYVGIVVAIEKDNTSTLFCEQSQASTSFPNLSTIVNQKPPGNNVVQCPAGYEVPEGHSKSINLGSSPNSSPKEEVRSPTNLSTIIPNLSIPSPTNLSIPSVSDERVNFDKGSTKKTISNSVITNQTKRYLLNCGSGQRMVVQISQGNINMAIIAPNGQKIGNAVKGAPQWQGQLPSDGDYIIEVSAPNQSDYTINIEVLSSNTPVSSTPEQTLKNFYELTVKDNKAAGKKLTTDNFRNKYTPTDADNQKTWVSTFSSIEVTQTEPIETSATGAKMTAWLRYSYKDGRPQKCGYRDFTFVLNNNTYLIDNDGEETYMPCN